jgi:endonuclease YncB( thermonuclease family)
MRALRRVALLIGLIGLWWAYEAGKQYVGSQESINGQVTHVRDGDTIEVSGRAIRLKGLTCDEIGTALGETATREIRSIVAGQTLNCALTGEHSYDRRIGWCSLSDGRDIGAILIARGVCGRCDRNDPLRNYAAVQREAGAFAGSHPRFCWAPW